MEKSGNRPDGALSIRKPSEIVAMKFDDSDLYLQSGIFARKQLFTLLGPSGVGKSRILLQLATSTILGCPFMGMAVSSRRLKWLIIQNENGCRRLKADLVKMREGLSREEIQLLDEQLMIHTLELDGDDDLNVGNLDNEEKLAELIRHVRADVVAFDPLLSFGGGSINTDTGMEGTITRLVRLARLGDQDCAIVIVHHAANGLVGIRRAFGFDRSAFGRASKILNHKTRGQINIAPANPDSNAELVVTCGKNSNGPEFDPIGVRLNPATMMYEVNPDFDAAAWRAEVSSSKLGERGISPKMVAELVKQSPLTKKDLVAAIMDEFGCGKSTAYNAIHAGEGVTIRRNARKEFEPMTGE